MSRHMTNLVDVEMGVDGHPEGLYESIIKTFSKEGDLVLDIGSRNGNLVSVVLCNMLDSNIF